MFIPHAVNDDLLIKIPRPHVRGQRREGGDALKAPDALIFAFRRSFRRLLRSVAPTLRPTLQVNPREWDKPPFTQELAVLPRPRRQAPVKNDKAAKKKSGKKKKRLFA